MPNPTDGIDIRLACEAARKNNWRSELRAKNVDNDAKTFKLSSPMDEKKLYQPSCRWSPELHEEKPKFQRKLRSTEKYVRSDFLKIHPFRPSASVIVISSVNYSVVARRTSALSTVIIDTIIKRRERRSLTTRMRKRLTLVALALKHENNLLGG